MTISQAQKMIGPSNASAKGLLVPGNIINLYNRPATQPPAGPEGLNPNAGYSTTYSKSFNIGGREVLMPTVVNGQFLSDNEAINRYLQTVQHLGIFDTPENADSYSQALHESQQVMSTINGAVAR